MEEKNLIISANWKMNKTPKEAENLIEELKSKVTKVKNEIIIFAPFIDMHVATKLTKDTNLKIGAQNCHFENFGAYTGEISPNMLKEIGIKYVLLGHSERRLYCNETDEIINKKIKTALKEGLKVILCVGESLQDKNFNVVEEKISVQIKKALYMVEEKYLEKIIIAYEPVWAIGSGVYASNEEITSIFRIIKKILLNMFSTSAIQKIKILYGGSINAQNIKNFLKIKELDGILVGGESLKTEEFLKIIKSVSN